MDEFALMNVNVEEDVPLAFSAPTLPAIPETPAVPLEEPDRLEGTADEATASPAARRPSLAMRVAVFPVDILVVDGPTAFEAGEDLSAQSFRVKAPGVLTVDGFIAAGTTPTYLLLSLTGGDDGIPNYAALNTAADETLGAWFRHERHVPRGALVNLRVNASTTLGALIVQFREGV